MTSAPQSDPRALQRVIFPLEHDPDIVPLYVDADDWTILPLYEDRGTVKRQRGFVHEATNRAAVRLTDIGIFGCFESRRSMRVPSGRRVSFGTYFNAFPASYWKRWTVLRSVRLEVRTSGTGRVLVYRSNARGVTQRVETVTVSDEQTSSFDLPFTYFGDGGWYWFDLVTEDEGFLLREATWYAPDDAPTRPEGSASIAITTYNRAEYCTALLTDIGSDAEVMRHIDRVYVMDQGTQKIVDDPGYARAREALGDRLDVIVQPNLGGSGGFSRGMIETKQAAVSDNVLLLDDDIAIEPEGILRALRFADFAAVPTIVGGHMFDMYDKSRLHAYAEAIEKWNFWWGPISPGRHDFKESNLRQTPWMHRRLDAQYNGWWMCLIPVEIVREIGLSLPFFIKWDDAEYALRAAEYGYPTVSLPGAAAWHVSWVDKDDSQDWQAFFHARNRLVAALLHSETKGITRANLATDWRHLLSYQYYAVAARLQAYDYVLNRDPKDLFADMKTRQGNARELAKRHTDGQVIRDPDQLAALGGGKANAALRGARRNPPPGVGRFLVAAQFALRHLTTAPRSASRRVPEAKLAYDEARWWIVPQFDSVLVTNAEGSGATFQHRDRKQFLRMALSSFRSAWLLRRRWRALSVTYRAALPYLTSSSSWSEAIGIDSSDTADTEQANAPST